MSKSDSDEDIGIPSEFSKTRKSKIKRVESSNSEDESNAMFLRRRNSKTPLKSDTKSETRKRSSDRLRKKKQFSLPSREERLEIISPGTMKSSTKTMRELKPRRQVNNFIRERNYYASEKDGDIFLTDDNLSDFIVDGDDDDDDDDGEEEEKSSSDSTTPDDKPLKKRKCTRKRKQATEKKNNKRKSTRRKILGSSGSENDCNNKETNNDSSEDEEKGNSQPCVTAVRRSSRRKELIEKKDFKNQKFAQLKENRRKSSAKEKTDSKKDEKVKCDDDGDNVLQSPIDISEEENDSDFEC